MDWPSMSPDLNPIEHMWCILKEKVEERKVSNIHQLRDVIMEWKRTTVATCEALVNSMPKRVKAVLKKIMVAIQNIDTLGPIWTFSLRGVLTFVVSGLDINGCVLLWGDSKFTLLFIQTVHSLLYTVAKCSLFSVVTWKYIIKYLQKCEGCTHFSEIWYTQVNLILFPFCHSV